jgi:RNA polymerase sigma factor (sigma-70 family)
MPADDVDAEIVRLAAAGDARKAADLLARTYQKFVRDYIRRRVRANAVDDVAAKVWSVVASKVPTDLASPRGYLVGIARHKIGHALDERSHHALDSFIAEQPMWKSASSSVRGKLARAQQIEAVRAAVAALDAYDRELIQLSFIDGLRPAEIAAAMGRGTEPKTVSKQISRVVDSLRDRIKR